jgi:broad specificity phosphatase PhoE
MTRVLLVRHAPTEETGKKLTGRLPGVSLGPKGRDAAEQTAAHLRELKIDAIYASPIERTWETAQIIAASHGLDPVPEDGILEVDYGRWSR